MRCPTCGCDNPPGGSFCRSCGAVLATTPPARTTQPGPGSTLPQQQANLGAAALVFAVCAVLSWVTWDLLSVPSRIINAALPSVGCTRVPAGTPAMYLCSAAVGLRVIAVPVILLVLVVRFRGVLAKAVERVAPHVPASSRFLLAPALTTLVFVLAWAGSHYGMATEVGVLPQRVFPAVVGLFAFAVAVYGGRLQRSLGPFFEVRDRFPRWVGLAVALGVPLAISLAITRQVRVTQPALKEQFVVLVALGTGFLALTPRGGGLMSAMRGGTWTGPGATPRGGAPARRTAMLVGAAALLRLLQDLLVPDSVYAHDCSGPADCLQTPGFNATLGVGGGGMGVGATAIGTSLAEAASDIRDRIGVSLNDLMQRIEDWRRQSLSVGGRLPEPIVAMASVTPPTWQEIIEKLRQVPGAGGGQGEPAPDLREILESGKTARAVIIGLIAAAGAAVAAVSLPWILAIGAAAGLADKYGPDAFDVIGKFLAPEE